METLRQNPEAQELVRNMKKPDILLTDLKAPTGDPVVIDFSLVIHPYVPPEETQAAPDSEIWNTIYGPGVI